MRVAIQDDFSTPMAKMAALTALLNRELNNLSGSAVKSSRATRSMSTETDSVAKSADRADRSINQLTGRIRLFADLAAILGPGLAPIGAVGIPAVAGLANQLGVAALAGGTMILAFQGVGDALKAVNEAALEPTAANLDKAREAMAQLSPEAQSLVMRLQELRPVLRDLRDSAAAGFMPGFIEGIDALETRADDVERILTRISTTAGELASATGADLASSRWDEFFDFLADDAPQTLSDLGRTVGNLTHGMSELWMAFDPLNDDFSDWLLDVSAGFDEWAGGLDQTEGFQEFIDYVRTNGPQVAETFVATADAVLEIVEAAAPLGGPVLAALESIAKIVGTIADSDLGTPIMAAVTATALLSRASRTYEAISAATWGSSARTNLTGMVDALGTVTSAQDRATMSAAQLADAESKRAEATRRGLATLRSVGKAAGVVGALAVASTGAADSIGLTNTATLGLLGTMGGPWGATIGAATGLVVDAAGANNDFADAMERAQDIARRAPADFAGQTAALADMRSEFAEFAAPENFLTALPSLGKNFAEGIFGDSDVEEMLNDLDAFEEQVLSTQTTWASLGDAMTGWKGPSTAIDDLDRISEVARSAQPAMDALGITLEELQAMDPPEFAAAAEEIQAWLAAQDSAPGRTRAVADAVNALDDELLSTADSASALSAALEQLLGPGLNAEEAFDAYTVALREMGDVLEENRKTFEGNSAAALENRAATRDAAAATVEMLAARAEAGASSREIARGVQEAREQFIQEGKDAGFSAEQMRKRANAIGLTPKLVRTIFEAAGIDPLVAKTRDVRNALEKLPKKLQVELQNRGYDLTRGQIVDLTRKYNLTPKQVQTILNAKDQATALMRLVQREADETGKKKPRVDVTAAVGQALAGIGSVARGLAGLNDKTVTVTTQYVKVNGGRLTSNADGGVHERGVRTFADGGYGIGGRYYSRVPQIVAGGANILWGEEETRREAYISDKPSMRDRNIDILSQAASWFDYALTPLRRAADGALFERPTPVSQSVVYAAPAPAAIGPSRTINHNYGQVITTDVRALAREITQIQRDAELLLGSPA